jgi:hypothetical protein
MNHDTSCRTAGKPNETGGNLILTQKRGAYMDKQSSWYGCTNIRYFILSMIHKRLLWIYIGVMQYYVLCKLAQLAMRLTCVSRKSLSDIGQDT